MSCVSHVTYMYITDGLSECSSYCSGWRREVPITASCPGRSPGKESDHCELCSLIIVTWYCLNMVVLYLTNGLGAKSIIPIIIIMSYYTQV